MYLNIIYIGMVLTQSQKTTTFSMLCDLPSVLSSFQFVLRDAINSRALENTDPNHFESILFWVYHLVFSQKSNCYIGTKKLLIIFI